MVVLNGLELLKALNNHGTGIIGSVISEYCKYIDFDSICGLFWFIKLCNWTLYLFWFRKRYVGDLESILYEDIKKSALSKHEECLSTKYKNNQLPLLWRCKENHLWHASLGNVKSGKWCPYCAGNARLTLEDANQITLSRNSKCLSTTYRNSDTPMMWRSYLE